MRSTGPFPLKRGSNTIFGSDPSCDWELPNHLRLADKHVSIFMSDDGAQVRLQDLGAGTNVNGRWVIGRSVEICENDEIDIGPYAMRFTGLKLESVGSMSSSQLTVRSVSLTGSRDGKPMPLLQEVEIVLVPRDFACILGPSGCGKSTLMKVMSGRSNPDFNGGSVFLNHRDLHKRFDQVKHGLVLVPQKPVLHGELTVREALRYTARLRLPSSVNAAERVEHLIAQVGLGDSANKPVKVISGGQEKRLCLANELMSDPGLIFLDEVTSGLDELSDRKMMMLFRGLADSGKTVACITHSLANVDKYCNLLVVLGPGGCLAFVGQPAEAIRYFHVKELCDIYGVFDVDCNDPVERIRLQLEKSKGLAKNFTKSDNYQKYVKSRLPAEAPPAANRAVHFTRNIFSEVKISAWQTGILTIRSLQILSRDLATVASLVLQLVLVALILILGFGAFEKIPEWKDQRERIEYENYSNRQKEEGDKKDDDLYVITAATHRRMDYVRKLLNLTFLLGVTSFWFGCNNAAKEIVREKLINTQERMFNLRPFAYFLSKLLILGTVSCVQASALLAIVWFWCCGQVNVGYGMGNGTWAFLPFVLTLAFVGTTLGLAISALSKSTDVAVSMIPIAVIPQIILSGAIVKLTGWSKWVAQMFVTTHWGKQGLDSSILGKIEKVAEGSSKVEPQTDVAMREVGEFARGAADFINSDSAYLPATILGVHAFIFCAITLATLSSDGTLKGTLQKVSACFLKLDPRSWVGKPM